MDWLRRTTGVGRAGVGVGDAHEDASPAPVSWRSAAEASAALRRTAWVPAVEAGPFGAGSGFGGRPYLAPGVTNPVCPQCGEPMPLIAQIELAGQPAPVIAGEGLFQLFYCTREIDENPCDTMLEGWAPFSEGHVARLVPATPGGTVPDVATPFEPVRVTAWTPVDDHPGWEDLEELGIVDALQSAEEHPALEGEKLGGWPAWVQAPEYPSCPLCGSRMEVVLQVDSRKTIPTMWGDVGIGHVTQCPNDPEVLTFAWAC